MTEGTDLWAGNRVNYAAMASAIKLAYINVWIGTYSDPARDVHREGCTQAGVETGPYYVGNYTMPVKPTVGVPLYQKMLELSAPFGLIPALDFEFVGAWGRPDRAHLLTWLQAFYTGLDSLYTGPSLFYCNLDMIRTLRPIPDWLLKRWLWLAYPGQYTSTMIAPWTVPTIHQYALDVPAAWAVGSVDLDSSQVLIEQLRRVTTPVQPPPVPVFQRYTVQIANPYYPTLLVRKGPGFGFAPTGSPLNNGAQVTILEVNALWGRIATDAWIYLPFTKKIENKVFLPFVSK